MSAQDKDLFKAFMEEHYDEQNRIRYDKIDFIDEPGVGKIVWRRGTGDNVELLDIEVTSQRRTGQGTILLLRMLNSLKQNPPDSSIFGFTRTENVIAQEFYSAMGFTVQEITGLYPEGSAVLFTAGYNTLCAKWKDRLASVRKIYL